MNFKHPLVVILGATGSGKTKLSLDLARIFGGEIIGADSMQIYKGMDIISAKATEEERKQAPHHLVDILEPHETCTVVDYRNRALKIIDDLFNKNKLPIVVGGTNYYIESLLWKILVDEPGSVRKTEPGANNNNNHELSSEELHQKLQILDPQMARRLHPNNKRKILRSLEVLEQKGRPLSEILKEQQASSGGSVLGGGLRYSKVVIFWLQWDTTTLDNRINSRVESMLEQGLMDELLNFHRLYNEKRDQNSEPDYTKGIYQMIGIKEFHNYLVLNETEKGSDDGKKLFKKGIEDLKMVTRRYARKQCRWINNRLLGNIAREVPPVYGLTSDDLGQWEENVTQPASKIIESVLRNESCPVQPLPRIEKMTSPNAEENTHFCEICNRVFVGELQWNAHMKSSKHWRMKNRIEREQKIATEQN